MEYFCKLKLLKKKSSSVRSGILAGQVTGPLVASHYIFRLIRFELVDGNEHLTETSKTVLQSPANRSKS